MQHYVLSLIYHSTYLIEHFGEVGLSIDVVPRKVVGQFVFVEVAENRKNKCMSIIILTDVVRQYVKETSRHLRWTLRASNFSLIINI